MNKRLLVFMSMIIMNFAERGYAAYNYFGNISLNNWTGLYTGINAGVEFNNVQLSSEQLGFTNPSETCNENSNFSSFFPGFQLGYMFQFHSNWVSGVETNITFNTNQNTILNCNCSNTPIVFDRFTFKNQLQTSVKGRVGRAFQWKKNFILPYLTAGASFAKVGLTYKNEANDYYNTGTTQAGGVVGVGIEWALSQYWSLRAEYTYIDYGNIIKLQIPIIYDLIDPNGSGHVNLNSNNILIAISYWI